jgi:hypothetical protein
MAECYSGHSNQVMCSNAEGEGAKLAKATRAVERMVFADENSKL